MAVNVWYHVGSKNEKPGKTGFAHLFEHLMFGGSEHVKSVYIEAMEKIGATDLNGTTNYDRTNYFENVPTIGARLRAVARVRPHGPLARRHRPEDARSAARRRAEREAPGREPALWRGRATDHRQHLSRAAIPIPGPSSAPWTISTPHRWSDVQEWFKTYYGPSNATISIAGDIDADDAKRKSRKVLRRYPRRPARRHAGILDGENGRHSSAARARPRAASRVFTRSGTFRSAARKTKYCSRWRPALPYRRGRNRRSTSGWSTIEQIATQAVAFVDANEIGSQFYIHATVKPGGIWPRLKRVIDEELARLIAQGPTADTLERVRTEIHR